MSEDGRRGRGNERLKQLLALSELHGSQRSVKACGRWTRWSQ
jgi:hypothetical protein